MLNDLPGYKPGPLIAGILEPEDLARLGMVPVEEAGSGYPGVWALVRVESADALAYLEFLHLVSMQANAQGRSPAAAFLEAGQPAGESSDAEGGQ